MGRHNKLLELGLLQVRSASDVTARRYRHGDIR
jgi:hypothetical protein